MFLQEQKLSDMKVENIRPYKAKELKLGAVKKLLDEKATIIDEILPYSPKYNVRAEPFNRNVLEKALTIISEMNMISTRSNRRKRCNASFVFTTARLRKFNTRMSNT